MLDLGKLTHNLHPRRVGQRIAVSVLSKVTPSAERSDDPSNSFNAIFRNVIFRKRNITTRYLPGTYRTLQIIHKFLDPKNPPSHRDFKKDQHVYLFADATELIDSALQSDRRSFKPLCEAMKKVARLGDLELWKEFKNEMLALLKREGNYATAVAAYTERLIETYHTLGRYLQGEGFSPETLGIGVLVFQYSREPEHDIRLIGKAQNRGVKFSKDLVRRYYSSGRKFMFPSTAYEGAPPVDIFSDYKDVLARSRAGVPRYVQEMTYASESTRVDAIISLFSYTAAYPSLDRLERIARRIATLPPYYDPELVRLRDRLGDTPSAEILFSQLVDSIADPTIPEPQRITITKLALLVPPEELSTAIGLISEILGLQNEATKAELFAKIEGHVRQQNSNLGDLFREVFRASLEEFAQKYPEKPLDEVLDQFTSHPRLTERATPEELERASIQYQEYVRCREQVLYDPIQVLTRKVLALREEKETDPVKYFALFAEIFRKAYGLYPFNTQILTCLMQLNRASEEGSRGVYSQVETGEGKSIDAAFLSAYYACIGNAVDVISFNEYLSIRDSERFGEFYSAIGLKSGAFLHTDIGVSSFDDNDILYTTHNSLVLHYLDQGLKARAYLSNKSRIGIIDEADSLLLDNFEAKARIAGSAEYSRVKFNENIYRAALEYATKHGDTIAKKGVDAVPLKEFRQKLAPLGMELGVSWSDTDLLVLLHFANVANSLTRGHDYIVRTIDGVEQVEILDSDNTGRRNEGSQWSYGLHECVAAKEGAKIPEPQDTIVEHSHHSFFKRYPKMLCLSGTLGDAVDRNELQSLYELRGFDVPPHRPSQRVDRPPLLFLNRDDLNNYLVELVAGKAERGQPVLLIAADKNEAEQFRSVLETQGLPSQLLDDVDNRFSDGSSGSEGEIVHRAGGRGSITIATNTAGRGTDVVIDAECEALGGLAVIIPFVPVNTRVERQARGRAGRQGKPGESLIAACIEGEGFVERLKAAEKVWLAEIVRRYGHEGAVNGVAIEFLREMHGMSRSRVELFKTPFEAKHDQIVEAFFRDMKTALDTLQEKSQLSDDDVRALRVFILAEWAHVYRNYDLERALSEIRLNDLARKALSGEEVEVDLDLLEENLGALEALYARHEAQFGDFEPELTEIAKDLMREHALTMTIGQSDEIYAGCVRYVAKLEETAKSAIAECVSKHKEIIAAARVLLRTASAESYGEDSPY